MRIQIPTSLLFVVLLPGFLLAQSTAPDTVPTRQTLTAITVLGSQDGLFQFTPGAWYAAGDGNIVRFHGQIVDEAGRAVDGFSVQLDNGSRSLLSKPSGPNRWQPETDAGQWEIVLDDPTQNTGWWWLTIGHYDCPLAIEFNAQCQQFVPLSESVKVQVVYPGETTINADWICHTDCQAGVKP